MGPQQTCSPAARPCPITKGLLAPVLAITGLKQVGRLAPSPGSSQGLSGEGVGPSGFSEAPCRASFGKHMRVPPPHGGMKSLQKEQRSPGRGPLKWGVGVGLGNRRLSQGTGRGTSSLMSSRAPRPPPARITGLSLGGLSSPPPATFLHVFPFDCSVNSQSTQTGPRLCSRVYARHWGGTVHLQAFLTPQYNLGGWGRGSLFIPIVQMRKLNGYR